VTINTIDLIERVLAIDGHFSIAIDICQKSFEKLAVGGVVVGDKDAGSWHNIRWLWLK